MHYDTTAFRARYRADIHPSYNAWLHAGFVLLFGVAAIVLLWRQATDIRLWEWLAIPLGLIFQNWGEYKVHKNMGHVKHRFSALFYKRHTGDHHSFFAQGQMVFENKNDWRIIFFPPWLIVVFALGVTLLWLPLETINRNFAALFCGTLLSGYLAYEILHACEHLPAQHFLSRLPLVRTMRRLHEMHHSHELMHRYNFNIVFPLWDWIYGTLYRPDLKLVDGHKRIFTMQHSIDLAQIAPASLLNYLSTPTRWHEWHSYRIAINGSSGSLSAGTHFDYNGGRAGYLSWRVIEHEPGQRWRAEARGKYGLIMCLTYECQPHNGGTRFTRTLHYRFDNWIGRVAHRCGIRKKMERDAMASLGKLSAVLEQAEEMAA